MTSEYNLLPIEHTETPPFVTPYINYKGVFEIRHLNPSSIHYETGNRYHGDGWVMTAYCYDREQFRTLSLTDMQKGIIIYTMESVGVVVTEERVERVLNKMNIIDK